MADSGYVRHWRRVGPVPGLILRRTQVRALSAADLAELRDEFGATDAMIARLRAMATETDTRDVRLDFELDTVEPID